MEIDTLLEECHTGEGMTHPNPTRAYWRVNDARIAWEKSKKTTMIWMQAFDSIIDLEIIYPLTRESLLFQLHRPGTASMDRAAGIKNHRKPPKWRSTSNYLKMFKKKSGKENQYFILLC